jgi:anti-anti-sigma factor
MANTGSHAPQHEWRLVVTPVVGEDETTLVLQGRLGHRAARTLQEASARLLAEGCDRVALDLAGVDYISSDGVRAIEHLATELEAKSGRLRLLHLADPVRLVLDLSGLLDRLETTQT